MPITRAIGNEGNFTFPTGLAGTVASWSADFTRVSSVLTGFSDSSQFRRLGLEDVTGSAAGFPNYDAASTSPGVGGTRTGSITLTIATGCTYQPTVIFPSIAYAVVKSGDSAVTWSFENSNGAAITQTWDETG